MSSARKRQKNTRINFELELRDSQIRSLQGQVRMYKMALDIVADSRDKLRKASLEVVHQCGIFNMIDYPASVCDALNELETLLSEKQDANIPLLNGSATRRMRAD